MTTRGFNALCRAAIGAFLATCILPTSPAALADPPPIEYAGSQSGPGGAFDLLTDGRIIGMNGNAVLLESSAGSGNFNLVGSFADGLISEFGASFFSVNPSSTHVMVGDGNFGSASVFAFALADLNGGAITPDVFAQENFSAAWLDDDQIAITYANPNTFSGEVGILNRQTRVSTTLMTIGGASAGIGITGDGTLITGNGFDLLSGGSQTGDIRGFSASRIMDVLNGHTGPIDFEVEGITVARRLSAGGLGLDARGDLFVGGGDFSSGDVDYFALLDALAVDEALNGGGPVSENDIFTDDPDSQPFSFYSARFNAFTNQWLVSSGSTDLLWRYRIIPAPGTAVLIFISLIPISGRRRSMANRNEVTA